MGADRAVHVQDEAVHQRDPRQIAAIIAAYARDEHFDAIFTGMQSQDRGSAQVGVLVAGLLGVPAVTTVVGFDSDGSSATVRRELEGGSKAVVRVPLPALFTCQLGLNTPRYPTLPNIMKAKKKEITSLALSDLLKVEPLLDTVQLAYPEKKGGALVLEGDAASQADELIVLLRNNTPVLR